MLSGGATVRVLELGEKVKRSCEFVCACCEIFRISAQWHDRVNRKSGNIQLLLECVSPASTPSWWLEREVLSQKLSAGQKLLAQTLSSMRVGSASAFSSEQYTKGYNERWPELFLPKLRIAQK